MKIILLFCVNLLSSGILICQTKQTNHSQLLWFRYYSELQLKPTFSVHTEIENRVFNKTFKQNQFIIHTRVHYALKPKFDISAGFSYSLQWPQNKNATSRLVVPEYRFMQECNHFHFLNKTIKMSHRLRIEERFITATMEDELLKALNLFIRMRYRFQLQIDLLKSPNKGQFLLKISNEMMFQFGKTNTPYLFDQNRFYFGFEQKVSKSFSVELGYQHLYQQRVEANKFYSKDILRLSIYHKLKTYK